MNNYYNFKDCFPVFVLIDNIRKGNSKIIDKLNSFPYIAGWPFWKKGAFICNFKRRKTNN